METTLLFVCAIVLLFLPIQAYAEGGQRPTGEIGGGYAFLHDPDVSGNFPTGWFVTVGGKLAIGKLRKDWLGVAGELTVNDKKISALGFDINLRTYSFMGGPTLTARQWMRLRPSAHLLAGIDMERTSSDELGIHGSATHFAFTPGGFVDGIVTQRFAIRAGVNVRFVVPWPHISTGELQPLVGGVVSWR